MKKAIRLLSILLVFVFSAMLMPKNLIAKAAPKADEICAQATQKNESILNMTNDNMFSQLTKMPAQKGSERLSQKSNEAMSEVAPENTVIHASDLTDAKKSKGSNWLSSRRLGLEMLDQEATLEYGYYIENTDGEDSPFTLVDDFFTDRSNLGTLFQPIDTDTETFHRYQEGEGLFVNLKLIKDFKRDTLIQLSSFSKISLYVFSGTYDDFTSIDSEGINMTGSYHGDRAVNVKFIAPEDDYVYLFYLAIYDVSLTDFGLWAVPSYYDCDIKMLECNDTIELAEKKSVELGGSKTKMTLVSQTTKLVNDNLTYAEYINTYAIMYEITLNEGQAYAALLDSMYSLGGCILLLDENKDKIGEACLSSEAVLDGVPYNSAPLFITPVVTGTYYIVLAGFYYGDKGYISVEVDAIENMNLGGTFNTQEFTIDISSLGTTSDNSNDPHYGYEWVDSASTGVLTLYYPTDTFTLIGENTNVIVDVYNGVTVVLKDCTVGAVRLANSWYSVEINADGNSVINGYNENASENYTFHNYEYCFSGVYFTGDSLTIEGPQGCIMDNAPIHIYCENYTAIASGNGDGSLLIATWVTGIDDPQLTIKQPYTINDNLKKTSMYFSSKGKFIEGYTFSANDKIYRYGSVAPGYVTIAGEVHISFTGNDVKLGDVNGDGRINILDALLILRKLADWNVTIPIASGDINKDNKISILDALLILRHLAGWSITGLS